MMYDLLNSCAGMIREPISFRFQVVNSTTCPHRRNRELIGFFRFSRQPHDRLALSGADGREPDALYWNHGAVDLCKVLQKTGKQLILAVGSRYERLIDELHHYMWIVG